VAEFVKGIPWTSEGFEKADVESSAGNLRALDLKGKDMILLWLQNREHTWWNVTQNDPIRPIEDAIKSDLPVEMDPIITGNSGSH
jgi:hypothetical protein